MGGTNIHKENAGDKRNDFIPAKQRAKRELARIWRLPRGSNTPPLWGELAKKKLSHAPLLAAGYLTYSVCGVLFAFYISNSTGTI